jgi:hypothetical protein
MATLRVNLSAVGNGCDQDPTPGNAFPGPGWYVFLTDCKGAAFVYAGKQYGPFPVDHGYAEIADVPTGTYLLFAIVNPFPVGAPIPGGELIFQSNFVSHFAVVDVCCEDHCGTKCVTLYNSGWHYCVQVVVFVLEHLAANKRIDPQAAETARTALLEVLRAGGDPQPVDAAIIGRIGTVREAFKRKVR